MSQLEKAIEQLKADRAVLDMAIARLEALSIFFVANRQAGAGEDAQAEIRGH